MVWDQLLPNPTLQGQATPIDLHTQFQPFQDLHPDEIQDQLQRLHIQNPEAAAAAAAVLMVSPSFPPEYEYPSPAFSGGLGQQAENSCGPQMQHHQMQHSNSTDSNSSIASSRKSSTGSSLIAQLLSPSPPPAVVPILPPQTEGMASSGYSPPSNGGLHFGRKTSLQNPTTVQKHSCPHR